MSSRSNTFGDFRCIHCRMIISADRFLSGVNNRNHCPYCLWSRHLDLYRAGDRLCACKGAMRPVGLTVKKCHKKYARLNQGELMLVHQCTECQHFSINRIAADDIAATVYQLFFSSLRLLKAFHEQIGNIQLLRAEDETLVRARLFGGENVPQLQASF